MFRSSAANETATGTGDPQNGEARFTYDPLGRLAGYTPPGSSLVPYGWDEVPNRTSAGGVTMTFDAADRPTSTGFATDLDGRLTAIPARGGAARSRVKPAIGIPGDPRARWRGGQEPRLRRPGAPRLGHHGRRHPHLRL